MQQLPNFFNNITKTRTQLRMEVKFDEKIDKVSSFSTQNITTIDN